MQDEGVHLELTKDEALVLFEFLARFEGTDCLEVIDQAEKRILWKLLGRLESRLVEPLMPNYRELVQAARARLRGLVE